MSYIKVEGHDGLVRDETTGAILNHSDSAIQARRKQRQLNSALDDINILKDEVSEIKSLLRELIKNASN
jgi:tRNA uridine 5-carbamoylmethylation protein Kti12